MADRNATNRAASFSLSKQQIQRQFDVVETKRAPQGFTVYKVLLTVTQSSSDVVTEVSLWQRYSAFVTLHKQLEELYHTLQPSRREKKFPDFPRANFFGRFGEFVIDERRQGVVQLLQFVSTVPELLHSQALAIFFQQSGGVSKSTWSAVLSDLPSDDLAASSEEVNFHPTVAPFADSCHAKVCIPDAYALDDTASEVLADSSVAVLPELSASPTESMADQKQLASNAGESSATETQHVQADGNSTGSDENDALPDSSIWEHKCSSPPLDAGDDDLPPRVGDDDDDDGDGEDDCEAVHTSHDGSCKVGDAEDDKADVAGDGAENDDASGSSVLLTDLSMIDDQLDPSRALEQDNEDASASVGSACSTTTSAVGTPGTSASHTPSGRDSPGMCMSPISPVARVYGSPGATHPGWFQDAVSASWDDIEQKLSGAVAAGDPTAEEPEDPVSTAPACAPVNGSSLESTGQNSRVHPVAQSKGTGTGSPAADGSPTTSRYERTSSLDSVSKIELSGDGDYVLRSAAIIGQALQAEAASDFELAFKLYKSGVGLLLSGVQIDSNAPRRDAVRRKTGQYLQRAETIHHRYLRCSSGPGKDRWEDTPRLATSGPSSPSTVPIAAPVVQAPTLQLRDFAVIRPLGKLILVQNRHTQDVYVVKTLYKTKPPPQTTSRKKRVRSRNMLPTLCPYMVRPVGHFDTPNRLFLLLEHAQRGALWNSLERFQEAIPQKGSNGAGTTTPASNTLGSDLDHTPSSGDLKPAWSGPLSSPTSSKAVSESRVRRWAAQIVSALEHLHACGFIWRDLQPKNFLLDEQDDILLTYASSWEHVDRPFSLWAQENLYTAPELNGLAKPTPAADWWSFGALLYELLTGKTLLSCHPSGIPSHGTLHVPSHLSFQASSFLCTLLQPACKERLGSGHSGVEEIKSHPFFAGVLWNNSH